MNTKLSDAESRVTRLLADFHSILDTEDMDDFPLEEPKLAVKYLCNALQPQALKTKVFTELKKNANKPLKKSVQAFINWLTPKVQALCLFETALPDQAVSSRTGTSGNPASTPGKSGSQRDGTSKKQRSGHGQKNGPMPPRPAPQVPPVKLGSDTKHASPQQEKKCYKCGDKNHLVFQCPQVTREEALELVRERRKEGVGAVTSLPTARPVGSQLDQDKPTIACEINGTVAGHITPDTGTEYSIVAESLVNRLKMAKQWLPIRNLDARVKAEGFGGAVVIITQEVKLNLAVNTPAGKLLLTNVVCWISPEELPAGKGDVLLSRPLMRKLGYDPVEILAKARALNSVMDMEDVTAGVEGGLRHVMAVAARSDRLTTAPEEASFYPDEDQACFPTIARDRDLEAEQKEVWDALLKKIQEAEANGASVKYLKRLEKLLWEKVDTFRLKLGNDPPVDMPPLEVTLKPDAVPVRCKARRYPPEHREFMRQHVEELVAAGMVYRNPRSKWCSPPLIVNKKGPDPFRMTIDVRRVNTQTLRILWPMPMLEVILGYLYGSRYYFLLDFFKGYWQFLLSLSSQELFSFLTDMGVVTPTRVLMGGSDSVAYCQATVQEMFAEFLYKGLLIWLDDLLGYHATEDGIFTLLEAHIAHNSEGHVVEKLLDARYDAATKQFQLLVHWRGLDALEDSWEPAVSLFADVPVLVRAFVRDRAGVPEVKRLAKALAIRL
uniref:Chromo domain-containing protein n=1 Tax=Phytophthora ramorum TaxID=164328 RepID=H3H500_PHYRM